MMLQFRSPTSISLYYFVLVARSRQTGRSYKSIPGDGDVLGVVVLRIVLVIVLGVAAILRYCFFPFLGNGSDHQINGAIEDE
jgi:hypothetical protein